jgi:hypothetical protein
MTDEPPRLGEWVEFYPAPKSMIIGTVQDERPEDYPGLYFVQTKYALFEDKLDRSFTDGFMIHPSKLRKV